ncbi:hypothetical protein HYT26_00460 [Candidatus Pacearchaeota archaeon]|nr:hypothetical protein [Candidatus Pacearchaeota archaeon]
MAGGAENNNKFKLSLYGNPWKLSTAVLIVISLILAVFMLRGGVTGNIIGESEIGEKALGFFNTQLSKTSGTLNSVKEVSGIYEVIINAGGKNIPLYFTKDGNFIYPGSELMPVTEATGDTTSQPSQTQKSGKPKVELFVMTYCPYGTQAEKGLIPVLKLLGNKIDGKIRFVHYFMHGEKEEQETYNQLCIREEQAGKYLSYLECFLEDGDSSRCLTEAGIDKTRLNSCMKSKAKDYYKSDSALSNGYGVQGSPTLIINGQEASSGRSSSALLSAICSAFNNEPEECNEQVSSQDPAPGFGYAGAGSHSGGNAGSCG